MLSVILSPVGSCFGFVCPSCCTLYIAMFSAAFRIIRSYRYPANVSYIGVVVQYRKRKGIAFNIRNIFYFTTSISKINI